MKRVYIVTLSSLAFCLFGGLIGFWKGQGDIARAVNAAEVLFVGPLYLAAAALFLLALKSFKTKLKIAYAFICLGMGLFALGMLQYVVLGKVNPLEASWFASNIIQLPFISAVLCLLIGVTLFARLVGATRAATVAWWTLALALSVSALSAFVALPPSELASNQQHLALGISIFNMLMGVGIAVILYRARAKAGPLYISSLAWMFTAVVIMIGASTTFTPVQVFLPLDNWYVTYGVAAIFFGAAALAYVKSAVEFNRIAYADTIPEGTSLTFFGKPKKGSSRQNSTAIDVVIYLAGFASNPTELSPVMQDLRFLTAKLTSPDQELTPDQQQKLAGVYRGVVEFLISREQVRKYTGDELHHKVANRFQGKVKDIVFWGVISQSQPGSSS